MSKGGNIVGDWYTALHRSTLLDNGIRHEIEPKPHIECFETKIYFSTSWRIKLLAGYQLCAMSFGWALRMDL